MPLLQLVRKQEKRVLSFYHFVIPKTMNALLEETSVSFPHYRIIMIMDYAGWHTTKKLKLPKNIFILSMPPYSPELNLTEYIWDYIREKKNLIITLVTPLMQ